MKLQYLAIIFIIIMMPILIVFSIFVNVQTNLIKTELLYDERLLNSTYDAIKAFQINTINTSYYTPEKRVEILNASAETFYNSLISAFKYEGLGTDSMKGYVPAIVFTLYDGYYIYSPFQNTVTNVEEKLDEDYENNKTFYGLKPYISYTCKYKYNDKVYYITYSMDNYILVDEYNSAGSHVTKAGYLVSGITTNNNSDPENATECYYNGITFKKSDTEALKEYINVYDEYGNNVEGIYYYVTMNGTKYYYSGSNPNGNVAGCADTDKIFYIDDSELVHNQVNAKKGDENKFEYYYNKIFFNNSGFEYYKNAYKFTNKDILGTEIKNLSVQNLVGAQINYDGTITSPDFTGFTFTNFGKIFDDKATLLEEFDSNFNQHRAEVIRAIITTNLSTAIASFANQYGAGSTDDYLMPKISETDWNLLENNICIATFFQGMKIQNKLYNKYCVVPNNFNKEYVDENDIYILKKEIQYSYAKANEVELFKKMLSKDMKILDSTLNTVTYYPGIPRINFETRMNSNNRFYNPMSYYNTNPSEDPTAPNYEKYKPFYGSYESISGAKGISGLESRQGDNVVHFDMYKYIKGCNDTLKKTYYIALGRERESSFKYTDNKIV